ncbi:MAG: BBP7 family outer membrane beta-barrel protein [Pirellulales bacterium]|nr:BBP7 family outer membrane beta-barrel protein [Pirellulales bacterium]
MIQRLLKTGAALAVLGLLTLPWKPLSAAQRPESADPLATTGTDDGQMQSDSAPISQASPDPFARAAMPTGPIHLEPPGTSSAAGPAFSEVYAHSYGAGLLPSNCCPGYCQFYVRGEYLAWWITGDHLPPLVTTSPSATPRGDAGVLGEPSTSVLFGNEIVNNDASSGARFVFGMCLSPIARLEGEWFGFGSQTASFDQTSSGNPILARPFFNLNTGEQDANLIAYPNEFEGTIHASATSQFMGAGIHASYLLSCYDTCDRSARIDFLYGFRYLGFYERLNVSSSTTSSDPLGPVPVGTMIDVSDFFGASSNFFGGNFGGMIERRIGRWDLSVIGWLAIGGTTQQIAVNGSTQITQPDESPRHFQGGLLALPTNIGKYNHSAFTAIPQLQLKVAYFLTPSLRWTFGYDLIYWSHIVRAADQVDLNVNPTQSGGQPLIGQPGPLFTLHKSNLFVNGISTGFEWRY